MNWAPTHTCAWCIEMCPVCGKVLENQHATSSKTFSSLFLLLWSCKRSCFSGSGDWIHISQVARLQVRRCHAKKTDRYVLLPLDRFEPESLWHMWHKGCRWKATMKSCPNSMSSQCLIHCHGNILRQGQGYVELDNMSNGSGGSSKSIGSRCGW